MADASQQILDPAQQQEKEPVKLPEHLLRLINGEASSEEKAAMYDQSLQKWWGEYASRKNDEEEEHVADSLLYDERKHLPRTVQRPDCVTAPMGKQ